jgi:hypothetical protein
VAIYTLSTSSNYSAIKASLASGDTIRIDTNTVRLTVDEQPLLTNITVDSPSVSGRMTVSGAYDLSTWSIIAGTVALIDGSGLPANAILGSATGGSANGAHGVASNFGTILSVTGGTVSGANGCNINSATIGISNGGSAANAFGTNTNNGTVTTSNGSASAVGTNITTGLVLRAFDGVALAIGTLRGGPKLIIGPDFQAAVATYTSVPKIYSIGEVSPLANIPLATEIVILSEGGGSGGFSLSRVLN